MRDITIKTLINKKQELIAEREKLTKAINRDIVLLENAIKKLISKKPF